MENFWKKEILGSMFQKKTPNQNIYNDTGKQMPVYTPLRMYGRFLSTISKASKFIVVSRQVGIFMELYVTTCTLNM